MNNKKNPKRNTLKTKQNKWEKRDPPHFSEWFFTRSLSVSLSKSLDHNPFMLLKLRYLLNVIFF